MKPEAVLAALQNNSKRQLKVVVLQWCPCVFVLKLNVSRITLTLSHL